MTNKINEMLAMYGLREEGNLGAMLDESWDDDAVRKYCRDVLATYPDLKKETWIVGIEGGDYIYSFGGNFVFITDDIWSFNVVATQPVLALLAESMVALRERQRNDTQQ
ncbi:hypothetical protein EGT74_04480 [Chitinophaga lutea]|uniref:Uncharacterized protein n=1 Tax=Chitinophaga lutea TaxID=2488634 RepID=A0A3N4Q9V2_9BACT|nr:hypothetical protein [Chitinophaga lutea]RPE12807.1 hypothetical protein EGT74_04480 [Chitinophaga lutea]